MTAFLSLWNRQQCRIFKILVWWLVLAQGKHNLRVWFSIIYTLHTQLLHQGLRPYLCTQKTQICLIHRNTNNFALSKAIVNYQRLATNLSHCLSVHSAFLQLLLLFNSVSILTSINRKQMWRFPLASAGATDGSDDW